MFQEAAVGGFEQVRANIRRAYEARRESVRAKQAEQQHEEGEPSLVDDNLADLSHMTHHSTNSRDDADVPYGLRIGAAWAWRLIVIAVLLYGLLNVISRLSIVVVP